MGDSRGHWEGDTLVVDVVDFTEETWFDRAGNFHSEGLHLVERFTPAGTDHINYEVTMEDPKFYSKPMKNMRTFVLMKPGQELYEYSCAENNRCEGGTCTPSDVQK